MSKVPQDVWCDGYVIAYMSPIDEGVNYAFMDALCDKMHALEPRVKFDNREWLGRIHYILFLGDHALALEAFRRATAGDGCATWNECLDTKSVSLPQLFSPNWQKAMDAKAAAELESKS